MVTSSNFDTFHVSIKTTLANDKSQQHDLHYQFTSGNDEVVLLFQMAAENILCCGNRMLNCDLN